MPITIDQIGTAQDKLNQVQQKASELNEVLVKVRETVLKNPDGTTKIDLTSAQKTATAGQSVNVFEGSYLEYATA